MTAWRCVKHGFSVIVHLLPLVGVVIGYNFVIAMIFAGIFGPNPAPEEITEKIGGIAGMFAIITLAWIFFKGGLYSVITGFITSGSLEIGNFPVAGTKFYLRLLFQSVLATVLPLVVFLPGLLLAGGIITLGQGDNPFFNALGVLLSLLAGLLMAIVWFLLELSHYIMVMEDANVFASIKKSFSIAKAWWKRLLWLAVLLLLIVIAIVIINVLLTALWQMILPQGWGFAIVNAIANSIINGTVLILFSAILITFLTSLSAPAAEGQALPEVEE